MKPSRPGRVSLGAGVPVQELGRELRFVREESPHNYPVNRLVQRRRVLAWVEEVPAFGLLTHAVTAKRTRSSSVPDPVSGDTSSLNGAGVCVTMASSGLHLTRPDGTVVEDWLSMEAEGERGDLYTSSPIPGTRVIARLARGRVTRRGPLRAELIADWKLRLPARRLSSAAGVPRTVRASTVVVRTVVQLDAGAGFVRVAVSGTNDTTDSRLRLVVRTGITRPRVFADAAFGPVERAAEPPSHPGSLEQPTATAPLHRYVSLFTDLRGATLFSDGLAEYEARESGELAVTLLRSVGELSRHDLPERPGHAGYPVETPAAQAIGRFEANFGFALHGPRSERVVSDVERMANDFLNPLTGYTWRTAVSSPERVGGVELAGEGLAFSCMKQSEDGEWLVLRCTNLLDRAADGAWRAASLTEALLSRLDETPLGRLRVTDGTVRFAAPPRSTITILAR